MLDGDADGDLIPNRVEFQLGLNPGSPIESIVLISSLVMLVTTFILLRNRSKSRNKKAKEDGFENYSESIF